MHMLSSEIETMTSQCSIKELVNKAPRKASMRLYIHVRIHVCVFVHVCVCTYVQCTYVCVGV